MKMFLKDIDPFRLHRMSWQYMQGYSLYYFYMRFPRTLMRYYTMMFLDFLREKRLHRERGSAA
jgi:hypothetical protein